MQRVLVTGMGRSGTGYMSALLTEAGIPCGHEQLYTSATRAPPCWGSTRAESSWMAAPWIRSLERGTLIVHVVRCPTEWLSSWATTVWRKQRRNAPPTRYISHHTGRNWTKLADDDPIDASMRLWIRWNRMVERLSDGQPYLRVRVESVKPDELRRIGDHLKVTTTPDKAIYLTSRRTNARKHKRYGWRQVKHKPHADAFSDLASTYGYVLR